MGELIKKEIFDQKKKIKEILEWAKKKGLIVISERKSKNANHLPK